MLKIEKAVRTMYLSYLEKMIECVQGQAKRDHVRKVPEVISNPGFWRKLSK